MKSPAVRMWAIGGNKCAYIGVEPHFYDLWVGPEFSIDIEASEALRFLLLDVFE